MSYYQDVYFDLLLTLQPWPDIIRVLVLMLCSARHLTERAVYLCSLQ